MPADYRRILEQVLLDRSYGEITAVVGCSRRDISRVRKVAQEHGLTTQIPVTSEDLAAWFPDGRSAVSDKYLAPAFDDVLTAMKNQPHFTLLMAWRRYIDASAGGGSGARRRYGYSQFCALFADHVRRHDLVGVLRHEPGRAMLVDWAGDTIEVLDEGSGAVTRAVVFVAVLPYSGVVFARAYADMKSPAWLDAHIRAFGYFGGVPQIVVPDNPTTAIIRPVRGDAAREVNTRYQQSSQLADHYAVAIVPTRVRRPRDKAAVENAVNVIGTRVLGYLEAQQWTSLAELNTAIDERVHEINHDLVRADDSTRWGRFAAEEQALLGPLPDEDFEEVQWRSLKAQRNYHITFDGRHYSVPYRLAGTVLRVRITTGEVTVFDGDQIVCTHRRMTGRKGQYATNGEHVRPQHRGIDALWSRRWFTDRATSYGPATVTVIEKILDRHVIEAQGYLDCQNILSTLGKKGRELLEAACQDLLNRGGYPSYTTVKRAMASIHADADRCSSPMLWLLPYAHTAARPNLPVAVLEEVARKLR
jgi:transposase